MGGFDAAVIRGQSLQGRFDGFLGLLAPEMPRVRVVDVVDEFFPDGLSALMFAYGSTYI